MRISYHTKKEVTDVINKLVDDAYNDGFKDGVLSGLATQPSIPNVVYPPYVGYPLYPWDKYQIVWTSSSSSSDNVSYNTQNSMSNKAKNPYVFMKSTNKGVVNE